MSCRTLPQDNKDTKSRCELNVTGWSWHENTAQVSELLIKSALLSLHYCTLWYKNKSNTDNCLIIIKISATEWCGSVMWLPHFANPLWQLKSWLDKKPPKTLPSSQEAPGFQIAGKVFWGNIITCLGFSQAPAVGWRQDSTLGMIWPSTGINMTF